MKSITIRIEAIEKKLKPFFSVPGTMIDRILLPVSGVGWSVGIGGMMQPKHFFVGRTIEEALGKAEEYLSVLKS